MLKNAKKTKIVCTLGPASDSEEVLTQLVENGLNVCRFNFSHGDHAEQKVRMDTAKKVREKLNVPVALLLDTKGPNKNRKICRPRSFIRTRSTIYSNYGRSFRNKRKMYSKLQRIS